MLATLSQPEGMKAGMCMAVQFLEQNTASFQSVLAAGYEDGSLALWNLADRREPIASENLHGEPVMALAAHGEGQTSTCW